MDFKNTFTITLLSISLCTACSMVSPTYTKPPVVTPDQWANFESLPLQQQNQVAYLAWWKKFDDATLNALMESGLANNNQIGQARGNLALAQGQLKAIELSWVPGLSAVAGYSSDPSLGSPFGFYGIWPQYALLNVFNTIALQKSGQLKVAAQMKAVEATRLVLVGQIANSYYTYIAQVEQLSLYQQYQKDVHEIVSIKKAEYRGGMNSGIDVENIAEKMSQSIVQQKTIEGNILKSQNALRYLINQNSGHIPTDTHFARVNTQYPNVALLPSTVLANRPDVAMAELQYHVAVQNKGGAYTQLLPSVQLDYFQGKAHATSANPVGSEAAQGNAYVQWSVNPAIFGQMDALNASEKTAYYHYVDTVRKALNDVDNDLINHEQANQLYAAANTAYVHAKEEYTLTQKLYTTGLEPYLSVLQKKLNVDQAAIEVNQMKLMQMVTLVNLYQDLGGGTLT